MRTLPNSTARRVPPEFAAREVGRMLDLLDASGLVEHDGRVYSIEH